MQGRKRSIEQIIEEQILRWEMLRTEKEAPEGLSLITVSREPGSGGGIIAKRIAKRMGWDLFHGEIIRRMAESAHMSGRLLETLDEKGISFVGDWISTLVSERHLWPDQYLQHLMKVIGAIGRQGRAVLVGRGASFVLPAEHAVRVRIVAPLEMRIRNVARDFKVQPEEAKRRVLRTDSERRAFIRKYFNADISNPLHYDLVINTAQTGMAGCVDLIGCAVSARNQPLS